MNGLTDQQLLRDYTERRADAAFAELVRRHVDLAYSAALRMVRDAQLAEDVTQAVFVALAQNTRQFCDRPVLSGWLHRTAQNLAAKAVRSDVRRRAREQEAAAMNQLLAPEPDALWEHIAPHLDAALGELSEPDRDAVLLRYFERKSAREMAQILGTTEDAAQKRVSRAVERLREHFAKHGLTVGASALVTLISANAVQAAPVGLAATISTAAALAGTTIAASTATATATKAIAMTTLQKAIIGATIAAAVGIGIYGLDQASTGRTQLQPSQQQESPRAEQIQEPTSNHDALTSKLLAPGEPSSALSIIVLDADRQPLRDAQVRVLVGRPAGSPARTNFNRSLTTDANGVAEVLRPVQGFDRLEVGASKDDYGSRKMVWDLKTGDTIPPTYTITLRGSIQIGGTVVDPEGYPIYGATVTTYRFWSSDDLPQTNKGEEADFPTQTQTTGADGRWNARNIAPELLNHLMIAASHPDFARTYVYVGRVPEDAKQLRDATHRITLSRGFAVVGLVVDGQDQPITGATIWAGQESSLERQKTKSDGQGRFAFPKLAEEDTLFSVIAAGLKPENRTCRVHDGMEQIVFRLGPGNVIRARVQNQAGEALPGTHVTLAGKPGEPAYDAYQFSAMTDSDGKFELHSAPDQPVAFCFLHEGYEAKRDVKLTHNQDNLITMRHSRQVQGWVLDASTKQPLTTFRLCAGRRSSGNEPRLEGSLQRKDYSAPKGRFTLDLTEEDQNAIEASSGDYEDQVQSLPEPHAGLLQIVFQLQPRTVQSSTATQGEGITPEDLPATAPEDDFICTTINGTIAITRYTGSARRVAIPNTINGLPVTSIGIGAFTAKWDITSVSIPDSVTSIGQQAFWQCYGLTSVALGNSLTSIGRFAFSYCRNLTSITIPSSVTDIGDDAFHYCVHLREVYFPSDAPSIGSTVFRGDDQVTVYYLPNTKGWGTTFAGRPTALWKP